MKTTGVVVMRAQIDGLHAGHRYLLSYVAKASDKLVIVFGRAPVYFTSKNPLPHKFRHSLILPLLHPSADILELDDHISDEVWSKTLDQLLEPYKNVTLYDSREGFKDYYSGKHRIETIDGLVGYSSTARRKEIKELNNCFEHNISFKQGIIYAVENRYPIVYPTVDIAVLRQDNGNDPKVEILLGYKKKHDQWFLPGGFVDKKDNSILEAAGRELKEEVPGLNHHGLKFLSTHKVEDWRYQNTNDSIMTSLFVTWKMSGNDDPGDDLDGTGWFTVGDPRTLNKLGKCHHILYDQILKHVSK